MSDIGLKHVDSIQVGVPEVDPFDILDGGRELLLKAHYVQRIERVDERGCPSSKVVGYFSTYGSYLVVHPCKGSVVLPTFQELFPDFFLSCLADVLGRSILLTKAELYRR